MLKLTSTFRMPKTRKWKSRKDGKDFHFQITFLLLAHDIQAYYFFQIKVTDSISTDDNLDLNFFNSLIPLRPQF